MVQRMLGNDIHTMSTLILKRNLRDLNTRRRNIFGAIGDDGEGGGSIVAMEYLFFQAYEQRSKRKRSDSFKKEAPQKRLQKAHFLMFRFIFNPSFSNTHKTM